MSTEEKLADELSERARIAITSRYTGKDAALDRRAASAISRLSAEVQELREALRPFVKVFEARRDFYSRRHSDRDLGYANFDKMPDGWPMEKVILTMGEFRRARAALKPEPVND